MTSLLGLSLLIFPFNYESRFERTQNQSIEAVHPQNYSVGVEQNRWRGLLEYTTFKTESGTAAFNVKRHHRDFLLTGGYSIFQSPLFHRDVIGQIYGGAGIGTYSERVETTLLGQTDQDKGAEKWMATVIAGASIGYKFVRAEVEGRPLFGENHDPQPQWDYVVRLGIQIPLGSPERKSISSQTGNKSLDVIDPKLPRPKK